MRDQPAAWGVSRSRRLMARWVLLTRRWVGVARKPRRPNSAVAARTVWWGAAGGDVHQLGDGHVAAGAAFGDGEDGFEDPFL